MTNQPSPAVNNPAALVIEIAASIEGQITARECALLYVLASQVRSGCIVEIGSYRGRSTICLAKGSADQARVPVYAVDPHDEFRGSGGFAFGPQDREQFFRNVLRTGACDLVHLVNLPAEQVAPGFGKPIELLWIDGDHSLEGVRRDFEGFERSLAPRAHVAFHDSMDPSLGPLHLIEELLQSKRYTLVKRVDLTTVLQQSV